MNADVLESYLIPGVANEAMDMGTKAMLGIGGVAAGLVGLNLAANHFANKSITNFNKKNAIQKIIKPKSKLPTLPPGVTNKTLEEQLRSIDSRTVTQEMQKRNTFFRDYRLFIKKMKHKYSDIPGIDLNHLEFAMEDDWDDFREFGFFVDALPEQLPDENYGGYSKWAYESNWALPAYSYSVWDYVKAHPECNARNYDDMQPFWDKTIELNDEIIKFLRSKPYYHLLSCGGDWDDGTMEVIVRPSDTFLKFVYDNTDYPKWELPKEGR